MTPEQVSKLRSHVDGIRRFYGEETADLVALALSNNNALKAENARLRKLIHDTATALTQTQRRLKDDDEMLCEGSYGAYITEYIFNRSDIAKMLQEEGDSNQ